MLQIYVDVQKIYIAVSTDLFWSLEILWRFYQKFYIYYIYSAQIKLLQILKFYIESVEWLTLLDGFSQHQVRHFIIQCSGADEVKHVLGDGFINGVQDLEEEKRRYTKGSHHTTYLKIGWHAFSFCLSVCFFLLFLFTLYGVGLQLVKTYLYNNFNFVKYLSTFFSSEVDCFDSRSNLSINFSSRIHRTERSTL